MKTTLIDQTFCPKCGKKITCATHLNEDVSPKPGDLNVCLYCCSLLVYKEDLKLAFPSPEVLENLPTEIKNQIRDMQKLAYETIEKNKNVFET